MFAILANPFWISMVIVLSLIDLPPCIWVAARNVWSLLTAILPFVLPHLLLLTAIISWVQIVLPLDLIYSSICYSNTYLAESTTVVFLRLKGLFDCFTHPITGCDLAEGNGFPGEYDEEIKVTECIEAPSKVPPFFLGLVSSSVACSDVPASIISQETLSRAPMPIPVSGVASDLNDDVQGPSQTSRKLVRSSSNLPSDSLHDHDSSSIPGKSLVVDHIVELSPTSARTLLYELRKHPIEGGMRSKFQLTVTENLFRKLPSGTTEFCGEIRSKEIERPNLFFRKYSCIRSLDSESKFKQYAALETYFGVMVVRFRHRAGYNKSFFKPPNIFSWGRPPSRPPTSSPIIVRPSRDIVAELPLSTSCSDNPLGETFENCGPDNYDDELSKVTLALNDVSLSCSSCRIPADAPEPFCSASTNVSPDTSCPSTPPDEHYHASGQNEKKRRKVITDEKMFKRKKIV